ncbi:MAG: adenosylcobinamide-GDP ribazoletransferase, partial [Oscillospiraceae bacterium]
MKSILKSIAVAFSLYSTVPMPIFEWEEKNMKYSIALFHLVGIVQGFLLLFVYGFASHFYLSPAIFSAVSIAVCFFLTGGIHLDGFCDTCDGVFSHAEKQTRLEILKDTHVGAFAIIGLGVLFVLRFGAYSQAYENKKYMQIIAISFIVSRLYSALSVLAFKKAKKDGIVAVMAEKSYKKPSIILVLMLIFFWSIVSLAVDFSGGIALIIVMNLYFILYKRKSYKLFGGVTGDLAGFFVETSETLCLFVLAVLN